MTLIPCFGTFKDVNTSKCNNEKAVKEKSSFLPLKLNNWCLNHFQTLRDVQMLKWQMELILLMRQVTGRVIYSYPHLS